MPKLQTNNRPSARILEARAGLIPVSDDIQDELDSRIATVGRAVRVYAKRTGGLDDLAIIDILHNLRHYCDSKALSYNKLDTAADEYYLEYVNENPWIPRHDT